MYLQKEFIEEFRIRLRAPFVALDRLTKGRHLPKVFAEAALEELKKAVELIAKLEKKGQRCSDYSRKRIKKDR